MPDQTVTATDSPEVATTPETGIETLANDLGGQEGQQGASAPPKWNPEDFLKGLELDPADPKKSFEDRFVPKSVFTQKTQALAEERKQMESREAAIFELARKAINERQTTQGPSQADLQKKELQELANAGDPQAQQTLIRMEAEAMIRPIQTEMALRNAYETAASQEPAVAQYWNEIRPILESNPILAKMAAVDNYAHADRVMIALGQEKRLQMLVPMLGTKDQEITALKAKLATYEKERAASLPTSTARAGATSGAPAPGDAKDFREAAERAWLEAGGRREDFK